MLRRTVWRSRIATNDGGARCGLDGLLQIKGIEKNPVAGIGEDFFHTYGGASLNEAIVEALWDEIFHQVLPHGSIRVRALITTGTRVPLVLPALGKGPEGECSWKIIKAPSQRGSGLDAGCHLQTSRPRIYETTA